MKTTGAPDQTLLQSETKVIVIREHEHIGTNYQQITRSTTTDLYPKDSFEASSKHPPRKEQDYSVLRRALEEVLRYKLRPHGLGGWEVGNFPRCSHRRRSVSRHSRRSYGPQLRLPVRLFGQRRRP